MVLVAAGGGVSGMVTFAGADDPAGGVSITDIGGSTILDPNLTRLADVSVTVDGTIPGRRSPSAP